MDCKQTPMLVHGYIDGELALAESLAFEAHVSGCAGCRALLAEQQALQAAVRQHARFHAAPAGLEARLRGAAGLGQVEPPPAAHLRLLPRRATAWQPLAVAAALLLAIVTSSGVTYYASRPPAGNAIADQAIDDHLRSLLAGHLTDVASSNQHTVKPWFAGKLDLSPPVKDLAAQGFPLVGGRLDYLDEKPVAALVYRHGAHVINVFVAAADGGAADSSTTRRGYNLLHWTHDNMAYWAVSDADADALRQLHKLLEAPDAGPEPSATPK
ncbi:MAG TPA: anti-sigma factor [Candidatus Sulfotelmatobacter sp.]|nr:anti-sigma factor [Candidatus Sulfotelmatobacter sp.]